MPRPVGPFVLNNNNIFVHAFHVFHSLAKGVEESHGVSACVGIAGDMLGDTEAIVLTGFLPGVGVRVANSKPELSQLLFISVRQRELVKSFHWIWSIYLYRFYLVCALVSHTTM